MRNKLQLKRILLICFMLIYVINLQAQRQIVSGTVISANEGVPLSGVSVMLQGASSGAVTDDKGKYSLSVPNGKAKIVFSYTGFILQTISVNNKSVINVSISRSNNQLSDVVVIGYGTRSKRDVTTAISTLGADRISKTVASSPELLM